MHIQTIVDGIIILTRLNGVIITDVYDRPSGRPCMWYTADSWDVRFYHSNEEYLSASMGINPVHLNEHSISREYDYVCYVHDVNVEGNDMLDEVTHIEM